MKAVLTLPKMQIEIEGSSMKDIFNTSAQVHEVFGEKSCGLCQSQEIRPTIREVVDGKKTHTYYEMRCDACGAKLLFGQHNEGDTLFPKRKIDADGQPQEKYCKNRGWHKYKSTNEQKKDKAV